MNIQKSSHRCTQQLTFQWQTTESNAHLPTENKRNQRLFTIYICKPVGSQLGQMVSKIRDWSISSRTAFTICKNQFHLPKSPRRRETGIQGSFEEMEPEFSFETFRPKKKKTGLPYQMFRCSRKFSTGTTQKVVFHLLSNGIFRILFVQGKQPTF